MSAQNKRRSAQRDHWTARDRYCLWYIGHMHALCFDQLQHLLARESPVRGVGRMLSQPRTFELVQRWVQVHLAHYQRVYHEQSGWVWLTRAGLQMVELSFRADRPADAFLSHVYWVNAVRLLLEGRDPTMRWISERLLQAEQRRRYPVGKLGHIPDGVQLVAGPDGTWSPVDIEVQLSKPPAGEVRRALVDPGRRGWEQHPLRYYVSRKARGVVRATYARLLSEREVPRPWVEIIELETLHGE